MVFQLPHMNLIACTISFTCIFLIWATQQCGFLICTCLAKTCSIYIVWHVYTIILEPTVNTHRLFILWNTDTTGLMYSVECWLDDSLTADSWACRLTQEILLRLECFVLCWQYMEQLPNEPGIATGASLLRDLDSFLKTIYSFEADGSGSSPLINNRVLANHC